MEIEGYHMPLDLYYEENHYWVKVDGNTILIGMDDFAQKLAGEIVFVQLPGEGKKLTRGKKFAQVESGKWLGKAFAPVNGVLIESNEELESRPELINEDCYGKGWMYRVEPSDMSEIEDLIHGQEAVEAWLKAEIEKHQ